jgi:hypothetical protein
LAQLLASSLSGTFFFLLPELLLLNWMDQSSRCPKASSSCYSLTKGQKKEEKKRIDVQFFFLFEF